MNTKKPIKLDKLFKATEMGEITKKLKNIEGKLKCRCRKKIKKQQHKGRLINNEN